MDTLPTPPGTPNVRPSRDGKLPKLLASRIDYLARCDPDRTYCSLPRDDQDLSKGYRDVSYAELARAIDRACWWLDEQLGPRNGRFQRFAYFGPADLRWAIFFVAAIKTGRQILYLSAWNEISGVLGLLDENPCNFFVYGEGRQIQPLVDDILSALSEVRQLRSPPIEDFWAQSTEVTHYPYTKQWEIAADDGIAMFHSSGTTGTPKIRIWTNRAIAAWEGTHELHERGELGEPISLVNRRFSGNLQMCHIGGLLLNLFYPLFLRTIAVLPPSNRAQSSELMNEVMIHGKATGVLLTPASFEAMTLKPAVLETLRNLDLVYCGSAMMVNSAAYRVLDGGKAAVRNIWGSVETSLPTQMEQLPGDVDHISFHPKCGTHFDQYSDDLYELVFVRDDALKDYQPCFSIFPQLMEYRTRDLFAPHPTVPNFWRFVGRKDDLVTLLGGENFHVRPVQNILEQHPHVAGALIGGTGEPRPFILLEPAPGTSAEELGAEIWPEFDRINARVCKEVHLLPSLTFIVSEDKPLTRSIKGDLLRGASFRAFDEEVRQLYSKWRDENAKSG